MPEDSLMGPESPDDPPRIMPEDSYDATPAMALADAQRDLGLYRRGPRGEPDKCLVLFLWTNEYQYTTRFTNAGMTCSEMIALLEIQKQRIHRAMEDLSHPQEPEEES